MAKQKYGTWILLGIIFIVLIGQGFLFTTVSTYTGARTMASQVNSSSNFTVTYNPLVTKRLTDTNLYLSYPLDGNANDISGNNRNGGIVGAIPTVTGFSGQAYQFDGSSNYRIYTPSINMSQMNDMSVTFRIKDVVSKTNGLPNTVLGQGIIKTVSGTTNTYWANSRIDVYPTGISGGFGYNQTNPNFLNNQVKSLGFAAKNLSDGNWHTIVLSYTGNTFYIYIDGQLKSTTTEVYSLPDKMGWYIGQRSPWLDFNYKGKIDDFRIYSKALTAEEANLLHINGEISSIPNNILLSDSVSGGCTFEGNTTTLTKSLTGVYSTLVFSPSSDANCTFTGTLTAPDGSVTLPAQTVIVKGKISNFDFTSVIFNIGTFGVQLWMILFLVGGILFYAIFLKK